MTKSEVKKALDNAMIQYNQRVTNYIAECDEPVRSDLRVIAALTMDCFSDFQKVIIHLANE